jgi:hypothetical protein
MFVVINFQTVFYIFVIYLHVKFHMPSSTGSLIIISLIVKENVCMVAMLLLYILQKEAFE